MHRDELLFQTVHQSSELWLKHAWVEAEEATRLVEARDLAAANRLLRRACLALKYVEGFLEHLELMSPWEYQEVRRVLGHGSGFDSPGFREIRRVSPPLYGAFEAVFRERGLSLLEVYTRGREHEELYQLAELLTEWDERVGIWRFRHFKVVARIIGEDVVGTQGTPVELLAGLIKHKMFPELWAVRTRADRARQRERLIPLDEIRRARERLGDAVLRTPLVRFDDRIWLKLENLQPIGSFKLRGALSAIRAAAPAELAGGVVTASAGNMGQGVAWAAREARRARDDRRARLGAAGEARRDRAARRRDRSRVPHEVWWQTMVDRRYEGLDGLFVHPVEDDAVMAGNGTIGLELCEDLAAFDTVIVPWGGGGLTTGIASAVKALRPDVRVVTAEPETAAPLAAALAAGGPARDRVPAVVRRRRRRPRAAADDVGPRAASSSTRRLPFRSTRSPRRSGCSPRGRASSRKARARSRSQPRAEREDTVVCIVSGGNIDAAVLARVL